MFFKRLKTNILYKVCLFLAAITMLVVLLCLSVGPNLQLVSAAPNVEDSTFSDDQFTSFENNLETIRQALKIPGMSVAVVRDQDLIWAAGFGYADLENQLAATPDTPYGLASVTKPVASVLVMKLVEEGLIDLDAPVTLYGIDLGNEAITVRHLLTHTSEGVPGMVHRYNGNRYGYLGGVIEAATGRTFATLLSEKILLPVGMKNTALNPINNWGGPTLKGMDDFIMTLGFGESFKQYPDVYARLAQPYQLDGEYSLIPGMYPLYHNPAAGLISSVTDLAKFDIALDKDLLVGDSAKGEMFSPAYSTFKNRQDLMYGLGWYVQDFQGLRLLWHSGRWSPSTSALYLKVPEKNLTFIVLANTDNLTVPFGLGNGDVSKSILALSFFRHFTFPEQHGFFLPSIDWDADEALIIRQLANVKDEAAREFLERELWSFRQVYASVGQFDQVEKLLRVNITAYPQSDFRRDEMFTQTAGSNPVIPPVVRPSAFVWLSRGMALWFVLVLVSVMWMVVRLVRGAKSSWWRKILWLMATLLLGPIAILIHTPLGSRFNVRKPTKWQQAWIASALTFTGYAVGWTLAIALLMNLGEDPHPLIILGLTYLLPLVVGFSFVRILFLYQQVEALSWRILRLAILAEVITLNLGFAVFFPMVMLLRDHLLITIPHPTSLFFWAMISFIGVVGVIILTPLQYWMIRRGYSVPIDQIAGETSRGLQPGFRTAWSAFLITLIVMIAVLGVTVG